MNSPPDHFKAGHAQWPPTPPPSGYSAYAPVKETPLTTNNINTRHLTDRSGTLQRTHANDTRHRSGTLQRTLRNTSKTLLATQ